FPLFPQDLTHPGVVPPAVHEVVVPQYPRLTVAGALEPPAARLVGEDDAGGHGLEPQLAKRVAGPEAHDLARVALAPLILLADHDAALRAAVAPVDVLERSVADEAAVVLDHDRPDHLVRILAHLLEPLRLRLRGEGEAVEQVARDLHVGEPALVGREILDPRLLEPDALPFEDRAEHALSRSAACRGRAPRRRR